MAHVDPNIANVTNAIAVVIDCVVFGGLAAVGAASWIRDRDRATGWFAGMFGSLFTVTLVSAWAQFAYADGQIPVGSPGSRLLIAVLALMPFCLYRFTRSFMTARARTDGLATGFTIVVVGYCLAIAAPQETVDSNALQAGLVVLFLVHWVALTATSATYFFREAKKAGGVSGRRMRLFAIAAIVLAAALLLSSATPNEPTSIESLLARILVQVSGSLSAILFWFALVPPKWLRAVWRAREAEQMQGGVRWIVGAESVIEVRERTLMSALRLIGGVGAVLTDDDGQPIAWHGLDAQAAQRVVEEAADDGDRRRRRRRMIKGDRLIVACGTAAPFFGAEEEHVLASIAAFGSLAEQRAGLLERERDANERLRQVDQLKTEFVAMVAHDLRSPMAVISGFADTIHDRWDDLQDEQKLEYLRLISRNTRSLASFVEDVLQVARMDSGDLNYDVQPFDPRVVVERVVTDLRVTHPGIALTVDAPRDLPIALGDADRNWQILSNLVGNAVKFSEGTPEIQVELRALDGEGAVAIAVHDHGVGIADEDLPRLFRRFSRVGVSRRMADGTGLGLYIVKSMVEAQGGRIWVQSTLGRGTTFTYTLPMALAEGVGR